MKTLKYIFILLGKGFIISIGMVLGLIAINAAYQATTYTAGDNTLTAETGYSLTLAKWNELVSKTRGIFTDSSNKVGIGTSSPSKKLEIKTDDGTQLRLKDTSSDSNLDIIQWNTVSEIAGSQILKFISGVDNNDDYIEFSVDNGVTTALTIDTDGKVIIGNLEVIGWISLEQEAWQTPSLENWWARYGTDRATPWYFKDSLWMVHLKGLVKSGSSCIFTLPLW